MDFSSFCRTLLTLWPAPLPPVFAVAVSGGSDSLCLFRWAQRFAQERGCEAVSLIVDHGLRPESQKEAEQVLEWLYPSRAYILQWAHPEKKSSVAREARYRLLCAACHRIGAPLLLLGHHQEDLLETVLMREQRQSDWRGLAGISALEQRYGITLLRPVLASSKECLREALEGHPYVEDPSNTCPQSIRIQARLFLKEHPTERRLLLERTERYAQQREEEAKRTLKPGHLHSEGYYKISIEAFLSLPAEEKPRYLWHWMRSLSYLKEPLSSASLIRLSVFLSENIRRKQTSQIVCTLGGVLFATYQNHLFLFREWGRLTHPIYPSCGFWDSRFLGDEVCQAKGFSSSKDWILRRALASHPSANLGAFIPCSSPFPLFTAPLRE
jgi:tRNA(Ile)-lysidine synthetase-like protein